MKSNFKTKYIELPLAVFASQYPGEFMELVSRKLLSPDSLFDSRYIVRLQPAGSGNFRCEIGYAEDKWIVK